MMEPTNNKHTMKGKLLFTGLDVHAKNITVAIAEGGGGGGEDEYTQRNESQEIVHLDLGLFGSLWPLEMTLFSSMVAIR